MLQYLILKEKVQYILHTQKREKNAHNYRENKQHLRHLSLSNSKQQNLCKSRLSILINAILLRFAMSLSWLKEKVSFQKVFFYQFQQLTAGQTQFMLSFQIRLQKGNTNSHILNKQGFSDFTTFHTWKTKQLHTYIFRIFFM